MPSGPMPYWLLIAVLHSTLPLSDALAMRLYRAALDLHERKAGKMKLTGDLATGVVRRLGKDMLLGSLGGPGFEAELDTPNGSAMVRFLVTRAGIEAAGEAEEAPASSPRTLN